MLLALVLFIAVLGFFNKRPMPAPAAPLTNSEAPHQLPEVEEAIPFHIKERAVGLKSEEMIIIIFPFEEDPEDIAVLYNQEKVKRRINDDSDRVLFETTDGKSAVSLYRSQNQVNNKNTWVLIQEKPERKLLSMDAWEPFVQETIDRL